MPELFPTTHATWLERTATLDPQVARAHVMQRYFEPLCAYVRASSLRGLGEPAELVNDYLAARLGEPSYLVRWRDSGIPLRRWLANGLITHARNRATTEQRRREQRKGVDPHELASATDTDALLALERAWAMRAMLEVHDRVRTQLDAEGRSSWWELFRMHAVHGVSYAHACAATGIPLSSASNVNRTVAARLRDGLRVVLERDGIDPGEIDRELAAMQDLLGA